MSNHFDWVSALSVYDDNLDRQHQQLLEQVNKLLDAVLLESTQPSLPQDIIAFLDHYIDTHFADEERYMQEHGYPGFDEHRALHQQFITRYAKLKNTIAAPGSIESKVLALENHLARWWIDHIGTADKHYAEWIRSHRPKT